MSLSPAVLDAMLAAGCTAEQIVAAVKADGAEQEQRLADKRAKDAERQRRHRASRDVTVTEGDKADTPLSPSPNEKISNPHPHTPGNKPRARKAPIDLATKPAEVSFEAWADFTGQRKKPFTDTALRGLKREADKAGWSLQAAIEESTLRGWEGFKADWVKDKRNGRSTPCNDDLQNPYVRVAARRAAERAAAGAG